MEKFIDKKVIVRANGAGVFFGTLKEKDGDEVLLADARRIYYWRGASECVEIAQAGCSSDSRITRPAKEILVENVLEIHPATEQAITTIEAIKVWKYR